MDQRGVLYDVGRSLGAAARNWRPDYTPALVHRELEIIRTGLHANAVRICGRDPGRVLAAAQDALGQGLHVRLSPERWNATPRRTVGYLTEVAAAAEPLRQRWPDRLIFSVGNEVTLFMRGIAPGRSYARRARLPVLRDGWRSGRLTPPLRAFLADAVAAVRRVYHGPVSYSSLPIEDVDWDLFDVVGVNYYWNTANAHRYRRTLERLRATGKPVMVTEFGFPSASRWRPTTKIPATTSTPPRSASCAPCLAASAAPPTRTWPGNLSRHSAPSPATTPASRPPLIKSAWDSPLREVSWSTRCQGRSGQPAC